MRTMTPDSIPVFLPQAGIGVNRGVFSPQIRSIDVFYTDPIITGFHVIGDTSKCNSVFLEIDATEENSPKVLGFFGFGSIGNCCVNTVLSEIDYTPNEGEQRELLGFYGTVGCTPCEQMFLEISGDDENAPKVLGFFARPHCSNP